MTRTKAEARTWAEAVGAPGAVLVAAAPTAVLAAPGFASDRDSTAPVRAREARR